MGWPISEFEVGQPLTAAELNAIRELLNLFDPGGAAPGQVLKVKPSLDGYDFGGAGGGMDILGLFGGGEPWSIDAADDATIASNTTLTQPFARYRDLTVAAGVVLTGDAGGVQVIACRTLTFGDASSEITTTARGPAGGAGGGSSTSQGRGALGYAQGTRAPMLARLLASGGGRSEAIAGDDGRDGSASAIQTVGALAQLLALGATGGGGGGGGGEGTGSASGGIAGVEGSDGGLTNSSIGYNGGPGGSGIGGGGGGASPGSASAGLAGDGGPGGGMLVVLCQEVAGAAGLLTADGADGQAGASGNAAGGGGGGGGLVALFAQVFTATPSLSASGGTGGLGAGTGGDGGDGGAGYTVLQEWR